MKIELLWFEDCPNHEAAEEMLAEILTELRVGDPIDRIEVPDLTFPCSRHRGVCEKAHPTRRSQERSEQRATYSLPDPLLVR